MHRVLKTGDKQEEEEALSRKHSNGLAIFCRNSKCPEYFSYFSDLSVHQVWLAHLAWTSGCFDIETSWPCSSALNRCTWTIVRHLPPPWKSSLMHRLQPAQTTGFPRSMILTLKPPLIGSPWPSTILIGSVYSLCQLLFLKIPRFAVEPVLLSEMGVWLKRELDLQSIWK